MKRPPLYIRLTSVTLATVLLTTFSACGEDHYAADFTPAAGRIGFGQQAMAVSSRADDGTKDAFTTGDDFGVFGYCVPQQVGNTNPDYQSASAQWSAKMANSVPDVFNNQRVTLMADGNWQYDYTQASAIPTTYIPKYWYAEGHDTQNGENSSITGTDNYRYTFFAYSPYDNNVFQWKTEKGAPKVKVNIPQSGGDNMDIDATPDAMLAVLYNRRKGEGNLRFTFSHVFTALGFEVNNFSEYDLRIHRITLSGKFYKSLTFDFATQGYQYDTGDTYTGTYVIWDDANGNETINLLNKSEDKTESSTNGPVGGKFIRLLSGPGGTSGNEYLGSDVQVTIEYTFRDQARISRSFTRPGTFLPQAGTKYTAQLNFVGDAFVLQFVVANGEMWEDGGSDDEDVVFE